MLSYSIIEDLWGENRTFCSSDYDKAVAYLCEILPFKIHRFEQVNPPPNGWVIPPKWDVEKATIKHDGEIIWDGTKHPLGVSGLSAPFSGTVNREELRDHLHTVDRGYKNEDALPFHYKFQYRPWSRNWGFCVPRSLYNALKPGKYDIEVEIQEASGYLDVLEYSIDGVHEERFVFVTSLNHQGMANANLAGCGVGIELFQQLQKRQTKFSYSLIILQPVIGSEYYLRSLTESQQSKILGALFVGMQGSDTSLALQRSAKQGTVIERVLEEVLRESDTEYHSGSFRSIVGYDEIVWEAYDIPMPSLTRFPFPEYHTSDDTLNIISRERLKESITLLKRSIDLLESQRIVKKRFSGVPATSHPRYDLYVDTWGSSDETARVLRNVMDYLPIAPDYLPVAALKERFDVPDKALTDYLQQWEEKGLIELL
jgi:aminopeptidase-like protein